MKLTYKMKSQDSSLAFFQNQLDNMDKRLYMPLSMVTWARDMKLRAGVTLSDESTSFIQQAIAAGGTLTQGSNASGGNMPWISPETSALPGVMVNGQRVVTPLRPLARELSYSNIELARSQKLGQSIDALQMNALNTTYQMNVDQMVYIGSTDVGATGLLNNAAVTAGSVSGGIWNSAKTADQILDDVNNLLSNTWSSAALAIAPTKIGLPPTKFAYLTTAKVSSAGNISIMKYIKENCISTAINGKEIEIVPMKFATGRGVAGADRMVAYYDDEQFVRFPMVPIFREQVYYQGIKFFAPYVWLMGEVEFVYPETVQYSDGI